MTDLIKLRRGTATAWTSANPVLSSGEPGLETDTGQLRIGDGASVWAALLPFKPWVALNDSDIAAVAPNDQVAAYTFVLADKHRLVRVSNASAVAATIPPNSSVAFALGAVLSVAQQGAGQVTLTAGAGVTLRSAHGLKLSAQYAMASLTKVGTDEWYVSGDTTT